MGEKADVTALAVQAKDNPALMLPLWESVSRLVTLWAFKYAFAAREQGSRLYDVDDLTQAGYLACVDAVAGYDPDSEAGFATYLHFHVRNHFAAVAGRRGTKVRPDVFATSLNAPLKDETDTTLADMLVDPNSDFVATRAKQDALRQDCAAILAEIDKLPEDQRRALMLTSWEGLTLKAAAETMGLTPAQVRQRKMTGMLRVRRSETGQRIRKERYPIRRVGLGEFRHTFTSEVEKHILWLEERGLLDLNRKNTATATDQ